MQVRRSGRHTVLVTAGVSAGVVASVVAYMVVDAAGSVLPAADYTRLGIAQDERSVTALLPADPRVDQPDGLGRHLENKEAPYQAPVPNAGRTKCRHRARQARPGRSSRITSPMFLNPSPAPARW
jgi:hypothetical protein